ncbi:MAG: hypothetical protein AB8B92_10370 [Gammaproteobacteria bacterium]
MPISSWASVMMASHCYTTDNTSHSMIMQLSDSASMLDHDQMSSTDSSDLSELKCNGNQQCSVSGCSGITAILSGTTIVLEHSTYSDYQRVQSLADPTYPDLLFRPPISLS